MAALAVASPAFGAARPYDFNGDGRQELAVHVPRWDDGVRAPSPTGGVFVVRTNSKGLRRSAQLISWRTPGIDRFASSGHNYFAQVASGDFNGDGFADLVLTGSRMVVVYGTRDGLDPNRSQGFGGSNEFFAESAAGDYDRDGFTDLAVTVDDPSTPPTEGVALVRGGPGGLSGTRSAVLNADPFAGEMQFADVNRDGRVDLAWASSNRVGLCLGTPAGPRGCGSIPAAEAPKDLAVADVTGDGDREIVLGVPASAGRGAGAVHVFRLTSDGVRYSFKVTQETRGVPGNNQTGDAFGAAIAVGRIDGDRKSDIAIGAPGEDRVGDTAFGRGRVTIVRGARKRVARRGNRSFNLGTRRVPGRNDSGAAFGDELTLLDHNGDRRPDLDVGAPYYNDGAGLVVSIRKTRRGLTFRGARALTLPSLGFAPSREYFFGSVFGRR